VRTSSVPPPVPPAAPLCLVGLRGAGKTTVGQHLAQLLERSFVDLDRALERRMQCSIPELLARGQAEFRDLEREVLRLALTMLALGVDGGSVVATGGGVVLAAENRQILGDLGRVIYLSAPPEVLGARVEADQDEERPALVEGGPQEESRRLLEERDALYREVADLVVDATPDPASVAAEIVAWVRAQEA
jgi:shikimate kinase